MTERIGFINPSEHVKECVDVWNSYAESGEVVFKPLTEERFRSLFCSPQGYEQTSVALEDEKGLVAYGFANFAKEAVVAYITYIGVRKDAQRRGWGERILRLLEQRLKEANGSLQKIELVFYNPCQLSWYIPNAAPHDHPGVPGVDMDSAAYRFFAKNGYADYAIQNAYYLPLDKYEYPADIASRMAALKEQGIDICYYDKDKNYGFPEFFDNIKNEGWRKQVLAQLDKDIVIASDGGKVVGYTGPLAVSKEGRGTFCGIGVHTEYRQHGIGKILFASLCKGLSERGAGYMSLFTGTTNPARKIYEGAGFKIVRTFADMRKVL